ncbi:MAG: WYL domain-containing protein [Bacteroidota bacterium]
MQISRSAVIVFDKSVLRGRPLYGSIAQTDLGDKIRAEFMVESMNYTARWLLMYGTAVEIEEPESLRTALAELVEELHEHYTAVSSRS